MVLTPVNVRNAQIRLTRSAEANSRASAVPMRLGPRLASSAPVCTEVSGRSGKTFSTGGGVREAASSASTASGTTELTSADQLRSPCGPAGYGSAPAARIRAGQGRAASPRPVSLLIRINKSRALHPTHA